VFNYDGCSAGGPFKREHFPTVLTVATVVAISMFFFVVTSALFDWPMPSH
jgi:hypothetical protein